MRRKTRKDSKLHSLPPEQRAKVDGWLFDKGLTYARVAEGCERMFGLKLSKSSVGRYFERETTIRLAKRRREERRKQFAEETKGLSGAQRYDLLMERIATLALDLLNPMDGPMQVGRICRLMRILIAEQRRRSSAIRASVERKRFEMSAAKKCLEHLRTAKGEGGPAQMSKTAESRKAERNRLLQWLESGERYSTRPAETAVLCSPSQPQQTAADEF